jgi:2-dehydro-3-deoxygalactonokinase
MSNLIIVDWGTSNFRAILLDEEFNTIDSISSNNGILQFKQNEFQSFLIDILTPWLTKYLNPTILMSGMIGSMNGWHETEYVFCDTKLDELSEKLFKIPNINENIYIVPGVKTLKHNLVDLMRGEEVQIFGAVKILNKKEAICVLPGTHSKWALVQDESIIDFKTNMTGEVFNVLSSYTILEKSINSKDLKEGAFIKGVKLSQEKGGLLNQIFQVRAQANIIGEDLVYSFLSGILIGHEIKEMNLEFDSKEVVIIGSSTLNDLYAKALDIYSINSLCIDSSEATKKAMIDIFKRKQKEDR